MISWGLFPIISQWFHTDGLVSVSSAVDEASIPFQNLPMSGRCRFVFPKFQHAFDEWYVIHYVNMFRCGSWLISSRFDWVLQVMFFSQETVSSLLKVLKLCFCLFGNLHFCCKPRHTQQKAFLHSQAWNQPSLAIPRLGCSWHVCMCACAHVFMKGKTTLWWNATWTTRIVLAPFIQLLETRMILTNNTKLGRTKRSCWRITTGRWWNGIAKILKKETTMSPRHSPHSPPRTFRRFGFSDVDDHLSDI